MYTKVMLLRLEQNVRLSIHSCSTGDILYCSWFQKCNDYEVFCNKYFQSTSQIKKNNKRIP